MAKRQTERQGIESIATDTLEEEETNTKEEYVSKGTGLQSANRRHVYELF